MRKQLETTTKNMKIYVRNNDINKAEKRREASRAGRARWLKKQKQLEVKFQREERNQFRKKKKYHQKRQ